jgi:two-component system chemotaxis response regulator CheB
MNPGPAGKRLRVLVVDDSAFNRQAISGMLEADGQVEVVGRAANGEDALREALRLKPDVVTLDLEMPRMDGFTFLRLLMSRMPTPVIVISSFSQQQNVFRALELGALDFIAKPSAGPSTDILVLRDELLAKVHLVRQLRPALGNRESSSSTPSPDRARPKPAGGRAPLGLVAVGASTGGPPALQAIVRELPAELPLALVVAQHMPSGFTRAFAERLHRTASLSVREAIDGEALEAGLMLVAPGGQHLEVRADPDGLRVEIRPALAEDKYVPSIDRLFQTAADAMRGRTLAILLTGMGVDGREGIRRVKAVGGRTLAESEETAVIFGMPREAIDSGAVDRVRRLDELANEIQAFAEDLRFSGRTKH